MTCPDSINCVSGFSDLPASKLMFYSWDGNCPYLTNILLLVLILKLVFTNLSSGMGFPHPPLITHMLAITEIQAHLVLTLALST